MSFHLLGWWFGFCLKANLNGRYYRQDSYQYSSIQYMDGIAWLDGKNRFEDGKPPNIKQVSMSISRLPQNLRAAGTAEQDTADLPINK